MAKSVVSIGTMKMSVQSELPIGIDMTQFLDAVAGSVLTSPFATMFEASEGTVITLPGSPTVNGNVVTQVVPGSLLTPGLQYNLFLGFIGVANDFVPVASVLIIAGI